MGCFFKSLFLLLFLAVLGLPIAAVVMGIDQKPLIQRPGDINTADLKRAQALAERYDPRKMPVGQVTRLVATGEELNTVLKGAMGAVKQVAGQVQVTRFGIIVAITVATPLPENPLGRYVNLRAVIAPSAFGLDISRFAIGAIEIPPVVIKPVLRFALDHLVGPGKADPILNAVKSVQVSDRMAVVEFRPPAKLVADLKSAAKRQLSLSHPRKIKPYIALLESTSDRVGRNRVSLIEFIRPVFAFAKERSVTRDPAAENQAAMMAIAIYFGDGRFERFVDGEVLTAEQKSRRRSISHVRLNGRHDFVQHFTISMGLALAGGSSAANLIGELKEVKDSGKKSGFSFTDVGADRIGVRFARAAMASPERATEFQDVLSKARRESRFFPQFTDLPEGMSQGEFQSRFGDVNSAAYKKVIADIDRRIAAVGLYR
jgi:hypothetical protein